MKSYWTLYISCIFGLALFSLVAFFGNGGGALVSESLPEPLRDILGAQVVPLPWPQLAPGPGSVGEKAIFWTLIVIVILNAQAISLWLIGFIWPVGIVQCPCGGGSRNRVKNVSTDVEKQPLLSDNSDQTAATEVGKVRDVERQEKRLVSLRVVTRGDDPTFIAAVCEENIAVVVSHIASCRKKRGGKTDKQETNERENQEGTESFGWILEVVTEKPLGLSEKVVSNPDIPIFEIVVPPDYETPNGTKCKARNLHFAITPGISTLVDEDFIVHLDEETVVTEAAIEGILEFIEMHPTCIGQGMTVFGRKKKIGNVLLTMCDTARLIDDYCCFRFFHTLGKGIRGMKGSNFVLNVGVERLVSFDIGPRCSLLEDAAFAVTAAQKGVKFGHFQGVMLEQSPLTFGDYFRQRRRWINGLISVCCESSVRFRHRWLLIASLVSWLCAPITLIAVFVLMCLCHIPATITTVVCRVLITAVPAWGTFFCAGLSFSPRARGFCLYLLLVVGNLIAIPIVTFLEALAVCFAILCPTERFEVVKK